MIRFAESDADAAHADVEPVPPDGAPAAPADPGRLETLGDEIAELAAHIHAARYRFLVRLREFDALFEEAGGLWGFKSASHWLSWRTSMSPLAARERVRIARALGDLPLVSAAMERGELSYSKVRALTRLDVQDPEAEEELVNVAREATAAQVEKLVRSWRRLERGGHDAGAERARHESRKLVLFPDEDGSWVIRGRLDPEVGALLEKALDLASEALYREERQGEEHTREPASVEREPLERRRADAVGLVAEAALRSVVVADGEEPAEETEAEPGATENGADRATTVPTTTTRAGRFQVVVHVDLDTLRDEDQGRGRCFLDDEVGVPAGTGKRLSCDASRVVMVHDADGHVLDVGRRTRTVPAALRRALEHRDRHCIFPACTSRLTDAHHIEHWAAGGETKLDNLVLLCRRHHRAVHEGGVRVERTDGGSVRFLRPDGRVMPEAPPLPAVAGDPVEGLREAEREAGVRIDAWTATPGAASWSGSVDEESFDVDLALGFFLG